MISIPNVPYVMRKNKSSEITMRGINYTNIIKDGDIYDSDGVVADEYPYISVKKKNKLVENGASSAIFFGGKLCYIKDGIFYYDGEPMGYVSEGEKQMAIINTKLVIFPDKKYFDLPTKTICELGSTAVFSGVTFSGNKLTVTDIPGTVIQGLGGTFEGNKFTVPKPKTFLNRISFVTGNKIVPANDRIVSSNGKIVSKSAIIYTTVDNLSVGDKVCVMLYFSSDAIEPSYSFTANVSSVIASPTFSTVGLETDALIPDGSYYIDIWSTLPINNAPNIGDYVDIKVGIGDNAVTTTTYVGAVSDTEITFTNNINVPYSTSKVFYVTATTRGWTDSLSSIFSVGRKISFKGSEWNKEFYTIATAGEDYITVNEQFIGEVIPNDARVYIYAYTNAMTRGISANLSEYFKIGDTVFITGSRKNDISFTIADFDGKSFVANSEIFEDEERDVITVERRIPDLDFICESNNRIYGCSNKDRTIHASALGDPTNFFTFEKTSDDSFAVAVGSEGDFTACTRYGSDVLFWKEEKLHKLLGSYPAEYALYAYDIEGVQAGSEKSICIINEVLYFKGVRGIYRYAGDVPSLISDNFGNKSYTKAVGGSDGDKYYVSMLEGEQAHTYTYLIKYGIWMLEDKLRYTHFARRGRELYGIESGNLYLMRGEGAGEDATWMVQFCPMYETMQGRKTYSRLLLRVSIPDKGYIGIEVRTDGGNWLSCDHIVGQNDRVVPIRIPINKCDKFEFRVYGKGDCKIMGIVREFFVGGES